MASDSYIFFTKCHWLYVQGVRRAIRECLRSAYGEEWWGRGVLLALSETGRERLQNEVERVPDGIELETLLDAGHFGWIVAQHHNAAFAGSFHDSQRAFRDFRRLASARNRWAHIQSISPVQAQQAANLMRQILADLRCVEALEIAEMTRNFAYEPGAATDEWHIPDSEPMDDGLDRAADPRSSLWHLWRQAQSYLTLEKSVVLSTSVRNQEVTANVTLKIYNTAPDSKDWPAVHFKRVSLNVPGHRQQSLGELEPGQMREVSYTFPAKQLIDVEFVAYGYVDMDKLFQFQQTVSLPNEVISPLQREFVERLAEIGVNEFVSSTLETIGAINPNMTLAEVHQVRQALAHLPGRTDEKRDLLGKLFNEFHLNRETALGQRIRELILALADFKAKVSELDTAIGSTDLALIDQAMKELQQIQISVLRIEDAIRTVSDGG